jgi:hypothetical protein
MVTDTPIKIQIVKSLSNLKPSRMIAVKGDSESSFSLYVTDKNGVPYPLKDLQGISGITGITNTDGNLVITGADNKIINLAPALLSTINSALQSGANISELVNDEGFIVTETDPIFQASEASNFVTGDKANLDNQSGVNSGDETTSSIQTKRPLKTINTESLEGTGNIQIDYNDLDNLPTIPTKTSDLINDGEDGVNPFITLNDIPYASNLIREDFVFSSSQTFTLSNNYSQVYSIEVQGQGALSPSQYTLIAPNQITINDTLDTGDYIVILYSEQTLGVIPYYTQSQTDNQFLRKIENLKFVKTRDDFPNAISGVRYLEDNVTYFITDIVDLLGDRLVCGVNTVILGASSENCYLISTGLNSTTSLITSNYSLPIRNISFTHGKVFDLDGDGVTTALDWFGVNFVNCANIGTIKDYSNFVLGDSAFLNSSGLIFDGTIGTIAFGNCLFDSSTGGTAISLLSTLTVSRRFRIIYSSFVTLSGETAINVDTSAVIGDERYILDTVNFSGGGTYISGVNQTSNKTLFTNCVGIANTSTRGFFYMVNNGTDTPIGVPNTNVWVKALGTTTPDSNNSKFTHTDNRLTYTGAFNTSFLVSVNTAVRSSGTNQNISIGIAKNGVILSNSEMTIRTANSNQEYPGSTQYQIDLVTNDYVELFVKNTSSSNVRVSDLNFSVVKILV